MLVQSHVAEWRAAATDVATRVKPTSNWSSKKGKEREKGLPPVILGTDVPATTEADEDRRARWVAARALLGPDSGSPASNPALPPSGGSVEEEEEGSGLPLRLAHFRLALRTHETTSKQLRANPDLKVGLTFVPDAWDSTPESSIRPLFGRDHFEGQPHPHCRYL